MIVVVVSALGRNDRIPTLSAYENDVTMVSIAIPHYLFCRLFSSKTQNREIGTGFYVEKKPSETNEFLERKLKIVDANSENITKAVQATR